jgi:hypothetical protein
MSNKFSFLITVDDKGKIVGKAYRREDTQVGINDFAKARDEGKECHFFQHPVADKRCKSATSYKELEEATSQKPQKDLPSE